MLCLIVAASAWGAGAPQAVLEPEAEKRVTTLTSELRCLVCQNQTLAESNAPLAVDLRNQVREQVREGSTNAEILEYMVARYGEFVLYRPPVRAATVVLWFGPFGLLAIGLIVLARRLAVRRAEAPPPLTEAERARARAVLAGGEDTR